MFFHFVKNGDTLSKIAANYNIKEEQIAKDNSLINPNDLVINQCLLINNENTYYTVKEGDTLSSIANKYNVTLSSLKKANPNLSDIIYPNQKILIVYNGGNKTKAKFNGYCYPGSNKDNVKKALPYLSHLSIFSYSVNENGTLNNINDQEFINLCYQYKVHPIMVITNSKSSGGFSPQIANSVINDDIIINRLFENIYQVIKDKGYYGLNIDFEYVNQGDKDVFINFIRKAHDYFHSKRIYLSISLAPKYKDDQKGLLYEAHDYKSLGQLVDNVIIMTYEWGYTFGPAMAVAPYDEVEKVIKYATTRIEPKKILMGIPNYGYDFIIPYKEGQKATSITNPRAIPIAYDNHAEIKHSAKSRTPSFKYKQADVMHEVHFDDPYSIEEKLSLIDKYHIGGGSIWTISIYVSYYYLLINNNFIIED